MNNHLYSKIFSSGYKKGKGKSYFLPASSERSLKIGVEEFRRSCRMFLCIIDDGVGLVICNMVRPSLETIAFKIIW